MQQLPTRIRTGSLNRVNRPPAGWSTINFREVWEYRSMLYYLVFRDIKARYKQTIFGISWTIISPLITMIVFSFVFGNLAGVPSYDVPYPLFSFAALVPWALFSRAVTVVSICVVSNTSLVTKIYFPRLILPISALLSSLVDFVFSFVILIIMMLLLGYIPPLKSVTVLYFLLLTMMSSVGIGMFFSAMHVRVRDITYIVPFMLQIGIYLTPVAYPTDLVDEPLRTLYGLNPMTAVCDGFRWALLDLDVIHTPSLILSSVSALVLFLGGALFYRRNEPSFVDVI